ncbi:hypothetical protein [Terrisporobacter vanillatitrophus]|uniref:hypothetical protein n=1 Tax=Terrisporobacter vanillatitrophus TaxID=3058402 RepID=UPI0033684CA3
MFDFLKKYFGKNKSRDEINYENKQEENNLENKEVISQGENSFEQDFEIKDFKGPKYILKEDAEIMAQSLPFPCDHVNYLPQTILKVRKDLVTDPDGLSIYINLAHWDQFKVMEETFTYQVEVNDPCGGPGTITGETLLKEIVLVAELHYSVLIYDNITKIKVYDGEVEARTGFCLYKIVPFDEEVIVNEDDFEAEFDTTLTRLPDLDGVDYYLYKVEGTVKIVEKP